MKLLTIIGILILSGNAWAQAPPPYPIYPPGMRVQAGASGALPRNAPSLTAQCGTPPHDCTTADAVPVNTNGVVQQDSPVQDPSGWWWVRVQFETGPVGWVSGYPPYLNSFNPPQMIQGSSFRVIADYLGAVLTGGLCIQDGQNSNATLALQPGPSGQQGTIQCTWTTPGLGNHIQVITAVNSNGSTPSSEFQFAITSAPLPAIPAMPMNLRINPLTGAPAVIKK